MSGWIKLYRQMQDDELWLTEPFTKAQAWVDLLINANHAENYISIRGNLVKIERGQLGWSELTMGKRWKWSRGKVRRYLELLKDLGRISVQQDRHITSIVTICNYSKFQDGSTTDGTADEATDGQQTVHKQECKEEKEVKKLTGRFKKPTLEDVTAYCKERSNSVDPNKWMDHYTSNGWKIGKNTMKDWKAAVRTWEKPEKKSFAKTIYTDRTSL